MRGLGFLAVGCCVAVLASCVSTSEDAVKKANKVFDTVCPLEPSIYATFVVLADRYNAKPAVTTAAAEAHLTVTQLCADRPTNIVQGAVSLLSAYNNILAYKVQLK